MIESLLLAWGKIWCTQTHKLSLLFCFLSIKQLDSVSFCVLSFFYVWTIEIIWWEQSQCCHHVVITEYLFCSFCSYLLDRDRQTEQQCMCFTSLPPPLPACRLHNVFWLGKTLGLGIDTLQHWCMFLKMCFNIWPPTDCFWTTIRSVYLSQSSSLLFFTLLKWRQEGSSAWSFHGNTAWYMVELSWYLSLCVGVSVCACFCICMCVQTCYLHVVPYYLAMWCVLGDSGAAGGAFSPHLTRIHFNLIN